MKPVKPPKTLDLGPHTYEVRCDEDTARLLTEEEANGDSRPERLLIRLNPDRPPSAVAETLLHECLHCVFAQTLKSEEDVCKVEEQVVTALAPRVLELLRRNPSLVEFLTA